MMRKFFLIVILLTGAFSSVHAQQKKFVISTGNPQKVPVIIATANTLAEKYSEPDIQIVLYGKAVKNLDQDDKTKPWLRKVKSNSIHLNACHIALQKKRVNEKHVPKAFHVVANAFVYILELKDQGYVGIEP